MMQRCNCFCHLLFCCLALDQCSRETGEQTSSMRYSVCSGCSVGFRTRIAEFKLVPPLMGVCDLLIKCMIYAVILCDCFCILWSCILKCANLFEIAHPVVRI
jgi:hypothetical protein